MADFSAEDKSLLPCVAASNKDRQQKREVGLVLSYTSSRIVIFNQVWQFDC